MFRSLFFALFWHLWLCWRASYFISDHLLLKNLLRTLWDYKITTVQTPKIAEYVENGHCFYCFWSRLVLLNGPKLQNTNSTKTFLYSRLQVICKQIITVAKGFSNSCPSVESVSFHQSCPSLDCPCSIHNASGQVLFEQRIFPLIFMSMIQQTFCLSLLLPRSPIEVTFDYTIE